MAFVDVHLKVVLSPELSEVSSALRSTFGSGSLSSETFIVTESVADPTLLEQTMVKVRSEVKLPVLNELLVGRLPLQLEVPAVASQLVALFEVHLRVVLSPESMEVSSALRSTFGDDTVGVVTSIVTVSVAVPDSLVHVIL